MVHETDTVCVILVKSQYNLCVGALGDVEVIFGFILTHGNVYSRFRRKGNMVHMGMSAVLLYSCRCLDFPSRSFYYVHISPLNASIIEEQYIYLF